MAADVPTHMIGQRSVSQPDRANWKCVAQVDHGSKVRRKEGINDAVHIVEITNAQHRLD